ncbi:hypothetical protein HDU87_004853 [Geranomyces variabilis]|uniref:SHSP domain-containing protein n=1 Tax=Geranomyces variabilis TaxID=109894 RepID=A0AAD5XQ42_9FUNG|nr:hypothetical protein HDU87_004853 [Geranomyces variabilis]
MPSSSASLALALVASSAVIASTDAFWLIPGSTHDDVSVARIADQTAAQRFRNVIADKYAQVANAVPTAVGGSGSHKAAAATPVWEDLLLALDEVSADVGYSASKFKGTLGRGIYMRETEDEYLLAMDVAGLHTNEVEITADKGTLRIKGERECPHVVGTGKVDPLCISRHYDASFTFPSDADEERANGNLDAGVVRVFVPKIKGQPRGVGRVIKLTGDAADYVYTETGAKRGVDATVEGVNAAAESVAAAAAAASASAAAAYDTAAGTVNRVVDNVVGSVYGVAENAKIAGNQASASAVSAGTHATASVRSAAAAATDAAARASAAAAASASSVSASIASAGHSATRAAGASASHASKSASSLASAASKSAKSAASHASATGAAATNSAKSAASAATETATPGLVERLHDQYVKPIKEHIYSSGSAEGSVPIKKEEL